MDFAITGMGLSSGMDFPNGWRVQITKLPCGHLEIFVIHMRQVVLDEAPTVSYMRGVEREAAQRGDFHGHWEGDDQELILFLTKVMMRDPPPTPDADALMEKVRSK